LAARGYRSRIADDHVRDPAQVDDARASVRVPGQVGVGQVVLDRVQ